MKLSQGEQAALECIGNSLAATPIITRMFVYSHSLPSYPLAVVIPEPVNRDNYTNVPSGFPPRTSEGVDRERLACSTFSLLAPYSSQCGPLPTEYLQLSPFHLRLAPPFSGRVRFYLLGQTLVCPVAEVDSSKRCALRPHWLCSLLDHDRCSLLCEALVAEVNLSHQPSPHWRRFPSCPVCVRSLLVGA